MKSCTEHEDIVRLDLLDPRLAEVTGQDGWREATAALISGGKSNLTFTLSSAAGELVLRVARRPDFGSS